MPLRNRVLPTGEIVADPARGTFTGNRGILHRPDGTLGTARWRHRHWLICALEHPRGHHHGPMPDRGWTALFFLDEATALAAGHRPCHSCRRAAYRGFLAAWERAGMEPGRMAVDATLHEARVTRDRAQVRHASSLDTLPEGTFVIRDGAAHLVLATTLLRFRPDGYASPVPRPRGEVTVLTPRPTVAVLAAGYRPVLHATAARSTPS